MAARTDSLTYRVDVRGEGPKRLPPVLLDRVGAVQVGDVIVRVHGDQDVGYIRLQRTTIRVTVKKAEQRRRHAKKTVSSATAAAKTRYRSPSSRLWFPVCQLSLIS